MNTTTSDTLKAAKRLKDTGLDEAQAEAIVTTSDQIARAHTAPLAAGIGTLSDKIETLSDKMATKEYVDAAIAGLRTEMAIEFKALYRHLWIMGTSSVGVTVALSKLLP